MGKRVTNTSITVFHCYGGGALDYRFGGQMLPPTPIPIYSEVDRVGIHHAKPPWEQPNTNWRRDISTVTAVARFEHAIFGDGNLTQDDFEKLAKVDSTSISGIDSRAYNSPPIYSAIDANRADLIEGLALAGAEMNVRNRDNLTPLDFLLSKQDLSFAVINSDAPIDRMPNLEQKYMLCEYPSQEGLEHELIALLRKYGAKTRMELSLSK